MALALFSVVSALAYVCVAQGIITDNNTLGEEMASCNTGWVDESGNELVLPCTLVDEDGDGTVTISREMEPSNAATALVFKVKRLGLHVTQDGERVFSINEADSGDARVSNTFVANLYKNDTTSHVEMVFSGFSDGVCELPEIMIGSDSATAFYIVTGNMATTIFVCALLVMFLMLVTVAVFTAYGHRYDMRVGLVAGIVFAAALWGFTDSPLSSISGLDLVLCAYLCYYSLMVLPVLMVLFVERTCVGRRYRSLNTVYLLCLLNIIVQTLLTCCGVVAMSSMVFLTQAVIALVIVISVRCLLLRSRETKGRVERLIITGLLIFGAIIIIALVSYWLDLASSYRTLTLGGIVIFVFVLMYAILLGYTISVEEAAASAASAQHYAELASTDKLTGLENRRAYDEHIARVEENAAQLPNALLTFFDLNGLKHMNDTYGHAAGDCLIKMAGECIVAAYGEEGECYRIGGDEFAAIIERPSKEPAEYSGMLDAAIAQRNDEAATDHKLSISRGWCSLSNREGELLSVSDWKLIADVRMYDDKAASGTARS